MPLATTCVHACVTLYDTGWAVPTAHPVSELASVKACHAAGATPCGTLLPATGL